MPSPSSPTATSKDYNSIDGEIIPQTRREANVIVKLSDTFDMGNKKPAVAPDTANDTGNTNLSAAAMSSADSGQKSDSTSVMVEEDPVCTVPNYQWRKSHNQPPPTLSPPESELELNLPPVENWSPISAQQPPLCIQSAVSARRRPRSTSAYFNQQMPGLMRPSPQMGATPPTGPGFYPPGHPFWITLLYDTQRPPLQQQISSQYNTRRPAAAYGNRPVISYDQPHYGKEMPTSTTDDTSSFSFEDGDEYDEDTDRALIPPPNTPQRRPSLRSSITANPSANPRAQSQAFPERDRKRARDLRVFFPKGTLYPRLSGNPMVKIENAISRRRQSYMGHENRRELGAKYLDTKLYYDALTSINLEFPGDLEGRTIRSSRDGGIELITGAPRGKGTAYPSDRASIADRSTESTVTTKLDVRTNEAHILSESNPDSKAWPESAVEDSVFGDTSSVSSLADTTFSDQGASLSSQSSTEELTTAADELVALLQADKELKPLYTIALTKASLGAERFERNFHRLLKMYAKDLKAEAKEPLI